MKTVGTIISILLFPIACSAKPTEISGFGINISDILPIGYQLATKAKEGSHTIFIFEENGELESDNQVNIQFSIEKNKFGLDWILLTPRNIADQEKFKYFVQGKGYKVEKRKMNGVEYLRVEEGGSLFTLCKSVIIDLYGIDEGMEIALLFSGIEFEIE